MTHMELAGARRLAGRPQARSRWAAWRADIKRHYWLYLMVLPAIVYYLLFHYLPMGGLIIAFKRFNAFTGLFASPWVGLLHFQRFFNSIFFLRLLQNTFILNIYNLAIGFPAPIILALMLNEVRHAFFKRVVQTASYLPYFISTVVITGIIINFLSPSTGVVNNALKAMGFQTINFLNLPQWFRHVYVWTDVWQFIGWGSIIYLAALTGIDPTLYESAEMDGAGRLARMWYISIPCIMPTIMVILLLSLGNLLTVGFEKVFLLYNPNTYATADVISTYVYRAGLQGGQYDFGTAVGLFNSVVNLVLLASFNWIAGRMRQETLW
jgi:putative aldouronate transport system permease protein